MRRSRAGPHTKAPKVAKVNQKGVFLTLVTAVTFVCHPGAGNADAPIEGRTSHEGPEGREGQSEGGLPDLGDRPLCAIQAPGRPMKRGFTGFATNCPPLITWIRPVPCPIVDGESAPTAKKEFCPRANR